MKFFDTIIVGGGIVGLAAALQLLRKQPGMRIAVLEKETGPAQHQSSRNSGVIHSGIYYRPGSLRALNCRRGYDLLIGFCQENDIPYEICGKIIAAVDEAEAKRLEGILQNGRQNGLEGIRLVGPEDIREIEPSVKALEAIWVPQSGIVDYGAVARKYAEQITLLGGSIFFQQKVKKISNLPDSVRVDTTTGRFEGRILTACAGLYADQLAEAAGLKPDIRILPFRGEFYQLNPDKEHLVNHLIYPLPNPNFPFLGVHFTRVIHGGIEAGPNAVLAFRREGYHRTDVHWPELLDALQFRGFRKIARKYWREGWAEMQRSFSKTAFVHALQRLIPAITEADVRPGRTGVRAMACSPDGELLDDFLFLETERMVHVLNAPSPAATASLAIGETIADKVFNKLS